MRRSPTVVFLASLEVHSRPEQLELTGTGVQAEFRQSMNRHTFPSIAITISALALGFLVALPARAAVGSLEIFPDQRVFYLAEAIRRGWDPLRHSSQISDPTAITTRFR